MTNAIEMKQIGDNELVRFAGGDYGDVKYEWDGKNVTPLYKVGDTVEVYISPLHIFTKRAKIVDVEVRWKRGLFGRSPVISYTIVKDGDDEETDDIYAGDIQRRK